MAEIRNVISADTTPLSRGLDTARSSVDKFAGGLKGSISGAVGGFLAAGAIIERTFAAMNKFGDIGDLAERYKVGTTELQKYGYAAEQSGSSFEGMAKGLQKLRASIAEAANQAGPARDVFVAMGVPLEQIPNLGTAKALALVSDALAQAKDDAERTAIATAIFGEKLAQEMIPVLGQGSAAMLKLADSAAVLDSSMVAALKQSSDSTKDLGNTFTVVFGYIAYALNLVIAAMSVWMTTVVSGWFATATAAGEAFEAMKSLMSGNLSDAKRHAQGIKEAYLNAFGTIANEYEKRFGATAPAGESGGEKKGVLTRPDAQTEGVDKKRVAELQGVAAANKELYDAERKNQLDALTREERMIEMEKDYNALVAESVRLGMDKADGIKKAAEAEKLRGEIARENRQLEADKANAAAAAEKEAASAKEKKTREDQSWASSFMSRMSGPTVDSLQAVGLGGGVASINDRQLAAQERANAILLEISKNTSAESSAQSSAID